MDNKTQCSVVLDLLPLYKEGLLRPDTNESVARHLRECADCRRAYEEMNGSEIPRPSGEAQRQENLKQAEPLRKFRFHFWMNLIGTVQRTGRSVVRTGFGCGAGGGRHSRRHPRGNRRSAAEHHLFCRHDAGLHRAVGTAVLRLRQALGSVFSGHRPAV